MSDMHTVVGWDVGGVQVKSARVSWRAGEIENSCIATRPFDIWQEPDKLSSVLAEVAREIGVQGGESMVVTMTAELSDAFRTKRDGVLFVLHEIGQVFQCHPLHVLDIAGGFVALESASGRPLDFAATNWVASALFVAERHQDCILIDIGSTTTDIIPIRDGVVVAEGRNDMARLASGELIYTGLLRTNPNTLVDVVPVRGRMCRVAAENFTVMADVYLLLGALSAGEYTCPTPDGRAKSRAAASGRLARLVCADTEMLSEEEILKIADFLREKQLQQIADGLLQVLSRLGGVQDIPVAVAGVGSSLAAEVTRRLGLEVLEAGRVWSGVEPSALPASAAAWLLARRLGEGEA